MFVLVILSLSVLLLLLSLFYKVVFSSARVYYDVIFIVVKVHSERNPPPPLCRTRVTGIASRRWSGGRRRSVGVCFFLIFFAAPDRPPSPPSTTPVLALSVVRPPDDFSLKVPGCERFLQVSTIVSSREKDPKIPRKKFPGPSEMSVSTRVVALLWCCCGFAAALSNDQNTTRGVDEFLT